MHEITLAARVKEAPLSLLETTALLEVIFAALEPVHARGMVDRLLSATRVLLDFEDGAMRARLREPDPRDVRVATMTRDAQAKPDLATFDVTRDGFAFMAPEQVRGLSNVDGRADLYAFGALAFLALTGRMPFEGSSALTLLAQKLDRPAPTLESVTGKRFPPLVELFVATCLATDRERRYPSLGVARAAWRIACTLDIAA